MLNTPPLFLPLLLALLAAYGLGAVTLIALGEHQFLLYTNPKDGE